MDTAKENDRLRHGGRLLDRSEGADVQREARIRELVDVDRGGSGRVVALSKRRITVPQRKIEALRMRAQLAVLADRVHVADLIPGLVRLARGEDFGRNFDADHVASS